MCHKISTKHGNGQSVTGNKITRYVVAKGVTITTTCPPFLNLETFCIGPALGKYWSRLVDISPARPHAKCLKRCKSKSHWGVISVHAIGEGSHRSRYLVDIAFHVARVINVRFVI